MKILKHIYVLISKHELLILNLFLICALFQIYLMTRLTFLYHVLKVLFIIEFFLLAIKLFQPSKKQAFIILCIIFAVLIRVPFYCHSDGMVLSSDNAQEAIQSLEIRDSKTTPFFLLDSIRHNGTLKYLCVAFINDILGNNYLYFVLFQLLIFLGFLYFIYKIFQSIVDQKFLLVFILANFAFIEVIFDYSLSLRAGPYLEMLFFVFLGISLFDFSFKNKANIFFSGYFLLFSVYIHPLAAFFVVAFILVVFIFALRIRQFRLNLGLLLGAVVAGSYHMIYYKLYYPKPIPRGAWNRIEFLSLSDISPGQLPKMIGKLFTDFKAVFENIFSFEFSYGTFFFREGQKIESVLIVINRAVIYLSFFVLVLGLFFAIKTLVSLKTKDKKEPEWIYLFFVILFGTILCRIILLSPKPFNEPRYNIDLAVCVSICYLFMVSHMYKIKKLRSLKSFVLFLLLMAFTLPHAHYYFKVVKFKEVSYNKILSVLERNGVKYLTTDWVIAHSIYLLSDRKIKVSDSLGPVSIPIFFPKLRAQVDRVPQSHKAYLFFSDNYPRRESHKKSTRFLKSRTLAHLKRQGVARRVISLEYYTIIIPEPARFPQRSKFSK